VNPKLAIIRENHHGQHFTRTITDKVKEIKNTTLVAESLKVTWITDPKGLLICIVEWCEYN